MSSTACEVTGGEDLNSMTGFGKCSLSHSGRQVRVEVKSVNHRYLDISVRTPHLLFAAEQELRAAVKDYASRGHIDIVVTYASDSPASGEVVVDMSKVLSYIEAAEAIAAHTGLENDLSMADILQIPDIISFEESDEEAHAAGALAVQALREALREMERTRAREGAVLWEDVAGRARHLRTLTACIRERSPIVVQQYAVRLRDRIRELSQPGIEADEQRVAQEVAVFADRCDVTEELTRLDSHLDRLLSSADSPGPHGRVLDFLAQELNREFNTIGSKSQDPVISSSVIEAKGEVEKIREQIQNIE